MSLDVYLPGPSWGVLKGPFIIIGKIGPYLTEIKLLAPQYKYFRSNMPKVTKNSHAAVIMKDAVKIDNIEDLIKPILCK